MFCTLDGRPLHSSTVTHQFQRILEDAGIPRRRFHDLRHSCATVLAAAGVPPRDAMEILGHSQISLPMNIYSHVLPETQREAGRRMEAFLRSVRAGGQTPSEVPTAEWLTKRLTSGLACAAQVDNQAAPLDPD